MWWPRLLCTLLTANNIRQEEDWVSTEKTRGSGRDSTLRTSTDLPESLAILRARHRPVQAPEAAPEHEAHLGWKAGAERPAQKHSVKSLSHFSLHSRVLTCSFQFCSRLGWTKRNLLCDPVATAAGETSPPPRLSPPPPAAPATPYWPRRSLHQKSLILVSFPQRCILKLRHQDVLV